ncbi:hypothetical protein MHYP_G00073840 [Metynnis hypsauchen]
MPASPWRPSRRPFLCTHCHMSSGMLAPTLENPGEKPSGIFQRKLTPVQASARSPEKKTECHAPVAKLAMFRCSPGGSQEDAST